MKYIVYLFPALMLALGAETTLAANFPHNAEVMVMAANNTVDLDVTMEMLDEDAESSSDIINVIELPVQEMHQEQIKNQRRIRQDGGPSSLRQKQGSPDAVRGEMMNEMIEAQQEAEEAKRNSSKDMGSKKGRYKPGTPNQ